MGRFEFYLLSWFHVYAAACTAFAVVVICWQRFTLKRLIFLSISGLTLLAAIIGKLSLAGAFLNRRVERLNDIIEATSPYVLMKLQGFLKIGGMYSLFIYVVPLIFLGCLWALWRTRTREQTFFYTTCLFGMVMMSLQFRLYYVGSVALYLPWMVWSSQWASTDRKRLRIASVVALVACSVALFPSFRGRLFLNLPVGLDPHYQMAGPMMPIMQELCKKNPGTVLAFNDAGHYLRFHTECSVIANNFLLTEQQQDKIRELDRLLAMDVDDVLAARPDIKYILAYYPKVYAIQPDGTQEFGSKADLVYMNQKWPLLLDLLQPDDPEHIHPRLKIRKQFAFQSDELGRIVIARVFEVIPGPSSESDEPDK